MTPPAYRGRRGTPRRGQQHPQHHLGDTQQQCTSIHAGTRCWLDRGHLHYGSPHMADSGQTKWAES